MKEPKPEAANQDGTPALASAPLLGCPFCGETPIIHHFIEGRFMLRCDNPVCPIWPQTQLCSSVADCAELWNVRWPTPVAALTERLGNALREQDERWGLYGDESKKALKDFKASIGQPNDRNQV